MSSTRRSGIWLIGAFGGVGTTVTLGIQALRRKLSNTTSLVTALPSFEPLGLTEPGELVVGGHDIRQSCFEQSVRDFQTRSNVFAEPLVAPCLPDLEECTQRVRPGVTLCAGKTIQQLADHPGAREAETVKDAIAQIQEDLKAFQETQRLDDLVVVSVASTEPPHDPAPEYSTLAQTHEQIETNKWNLPASSIYAWAALDLGIPYVNFTPSLGASVPAIEQLAHEKKAVIAGKDGKTGETLMKSVLAPMFALRNWEILSWVGHNIFGNRDGLVLDNPENKESKIRTKDQVVSQIVGYSPKTHVSIEHIPSLDDWKTAWDHIHFEGFLGVKMILQFIWQGCDSLLAAPLVLDLARLALYAQQQGEVGVLRHLACFFKNPAGVEEHNFFTQYAMLDQYVQSKSRA